MENVVGGQSILLRTVWSMKSTMSDFNFIFNFALSIASTFNQNTVHLCLPLMDWHALWKRGSQLEQASELPAGHVKKQFLI